MILLNNDLSSIPVAIEMGRLVFDNLKKVILYLMPVCLFPLILRVIDRRFAGWDIYRVHDRLCQCLLGNAACPQLLSPGVLLHHK